MSAEYEANRNFEQRSEIMQKSLKNEKTNDEDVTLEDLAGSANNSIIGKVKSRVSSIIPSRLSKWFSPSSCNNDSLNGSLNVGTARRRRRIEIEENEEEYDDEVACNENRRLAESEYKKNMADHGGYIRDYRDEDSEQNSDDDLPNEAGISTQRTHCTIKTHNTVSQPPTKRSRKSLDVSSVHTTLIASTPAINFSHRNSLMHSEYVDDKISKSSTSHSVRNNKETNEFNQGIAGQSPQYAFFSAAITDDKVQENLVIRPSSNENILENISSRRTLHLPSTSQIANERAMCFSSLKRQSLSGIRESKKNSVETTTALTAANILEDQEEPLVNEYDKSCEKAIGNEYSLLAVNNRKQQLNGTDEADESNADVDSASENSESFIKAVSEMKNNSSKRIRKPGLFNMSNGSNSRTSSFGNGINFYSHLGGRKSLFSGEIHTGDSTSALNNSTLSLTSLNRRQFNASIYGSTSALSDSRLLNTFSPFYKGKTTYGGAAAYKKYSSGAVTSRVCNITPTIIRPTSSLSTLSSSNNSLAATTGGNNNALVAFASCGSENTSAISSTAKRILDLINDFATPLSEAKKMANTNVKPNSLILPQAKSRLNESDLQTSRAIRLSHVRTPYTRPAVTLQPTTRNLALPPPVKELQVPSMSQLMQMKKIQNTTERYRQITMQNSDNTLRSFVRINADCMPPAHIESNLNVKQPYQQHLHSNKMKSKISSYARISGSKKETQIDDYELPPSSMDLKNIVFPQMKSVPIFDITLPKPENEAPSTTVKQDSPKIGSLNTPKSSFIINSTSVSKKSINSFMSCSKIDTVDHSSNTMQINLNEKNKMLPVKEICFKFSAPLAIDGISADPLSNKKRNAGCENFKFSVPMYFFSVTNDSQSKTPSIETTHLKSGSVLDALKKSIPLSHTTENIVLNSKDTSVKSGFGDQFRNSASKKWECDTCLVFNENDLDKCVACETSRLKSSPIEMPNAYLSVNASSFGDQFKKSVDQWECDICMIRNKEYIDKCAACETPRKGATASTKLLYPLNSWQPKSFGDTFKPKPNTWECPTCLINNKNNCNECIACQTKNPLGIVINNGNADASGSKVRNFKFGFSAASNNTSTQPHIAVSADTSFKSLATSQMSTKWECDACMTRNDEVRKKCVCCEQAKPGIAIPNITSNQTKFAFGSTASTKFTFGFRANSGTVSTSESSITKASVAVNNQETDAGKTRSVVFGNTTTAITTASSTLSSGGSGNGVSFCIQPRPSEIEKCTANRSNESKALTDKGNCFTRTISSEAKIYGLKFGKDSLSVKKDLVTNDPMVGFKFDVTPSSETSSTIVSTSPVVKSSLAVPLSATDSENNNMPIKSDNKNSNKTTPGGYSFIDTTNAMSQPSQSEFPFGQSSSKSISGEKNVTSTETTAKTITATFSFATTGSTQAFQTSTTSSTSTIKPKFSFDSNIILTSTSMKTCNSSISSTSASKLSFGGVTTASTTTKPISGSFVTPSTTNPAVTPTVETSVPARTLSSLTAAKGNAFPTFSEIVFSTKTNTTSTTPTLAPTSLPPANIFGITPATSGDSKPTAFPTMIFGSGGSTTTTNKIVGGVQSAPLAFGSSTPSTTSQGISSTWSKGGLTFGATTVNPATSSTNDVPRPPVFGSFMNTGSAVAPATATTPVLGTGAAVFGSLGANNTTLGTSATFGSVAANPPTIYEAGISPTSTQPTLNLFGSVLTAPSNFGATATFGNCGGSSNISNQTSVVSVGNSTPFGSFSSTSSNKNGDGASAPKKSEPAFNFGSSTSQIGSSGGFNFGTQANTASKPAFNFSASSVPTFNFTGSNSDATPNAPFQFNAGSVPASSNIFAPAPSTTNAPAANQARRKIRQPTRRLTPR